MQFPGLPVVRTAPFALLKIALKILAQFFELRDL